MSTNGAPDLLRLTNIDTYYGEIHILERLDLNVREGELVSLLGGNASGKSTTLKTILGLVQPRNGSVEFRGEEVTGRTTSYRIQKGMAIVPENRRLFGPMTVLENLEMGAYLIRDTKGRKADFERVYTLPIALRATGAARGDTLRRRAADGRHGSRADVAPEAAPHGRAVHGAGADPRRAKLRDHPAGASVRRRDAGRRAECEHGALDR
jgi:ABC-type sugar transport system ATPase subunit